MGRKFIYGTFLEAYFLFCTIKIKYFHFEVRYGHLKCFYDFGISTLKFWGRQNHEIKYQHNILTCHSQMPCLIATMPANIYGFTVKERYTCILYMQWGLIISD